MFKSIIFEVTGDKQLHCESCERRVEGLLKTLEGVRQVRAQARNQRIEVLFNPTVLEATAIVERLRTAGYETRTGGVTPEYAPENASTSTESSGGKNWLRSLAMVPGALLPLLPNATCPACLTAYAGVLSAIGLGFLFKERVVAPLIVIFLGIGIFSVALSMRSHRRSGPLVVTVLGSAAVVAGRLVWNIPVLLYTGVALLIGASFWNLWLKRPHPQQLLEIQGGQNK
jgi:copper chaperone